MVLLSLLCWHCCCCAGSGCTGETKSWESEDSERLKDTEEVLS